MFLLEIRESTGRFVIYIFLLLSSYAVGKFSTEYLSNSSSFCYVDARSDYEICFLIWNFSKLLQRKWIIPQYARNVIWMFIERRLNVMDVVKTLKQRCVRIRESKADCAKMNISSTNSTQNHARCIDVETAFCADTTLGRRRMNVKKTLFHSGEEIKKLNLIWFAVCVLFSTVINFTTESISFSVRTQRLLNVHRTSSYRLRTL